jgi:sarcosine oxidase, subunit gamma
MIEPYLRQSALDHLGLAGRTTAEDSGAAVRLAEKPMPAAVNLRGDAKDAAFAEAVRQTLGLDLPTTPNTVTTGDALDLLWLGPDEWLLVQHGVAPDIEAQLAARLRDALAGQHVAVVEVGEQYCCIGVAGEKARELIAKGCPLDLHPSAFGGVGHCAQSHLSKTTVLLHQVSPGQDGEPAFQIYTRRSFADYLWRWLEDAAGEYGVAVVAD